MPFDSKAIIEKLRQKKEEELRAEQARIEAERLQREKEERERKEAAEKARLEKERAEQARLEAERLQREKKERERKEAEEKARVEKERAEQEQLKAERLQSKIRAQRSCTVGKSGCDFSTIQEALDFVDEEITIHVSPGVYKEHLIFKKKVHLIGIEEDIKQKSSEELPIVVFDKTKTCKLDIPVEIEGIVFTHKEDLEFDNLQEFSRQKLDFEDKDGHEENDGLFWIRTNSHLKNIAALCSESYGISFDGDGILENSVIFHCRNSNVICNYDSGPRILNCDISNSKVTGVWIVESTPQIANCEIYNNEGCGIFILVANPEITACTIHDNKEQGISIDNGNLYLYIPAKF